MKRTMRIKIWCAVLAVACVSGVAFGAAGEGYVRIACTTGLDRLKEAFDRIEALAF